MQPVDVSNAGHSVDLEALRSVWGPERTASDHASKLIGVFSMMDPPTRKAATVEVTLVDGGLGLVSQLAAVPTLRDWIRATDAARPATLTGSEHRRSKPAGLREGF